MKASATRQVRQQRLPSVFEDFFGGEDFFGQGQGGNQQQQSSGSGVIISSDGYIATNNHVVEGADELEVITSDNKSFMAKVVGTDPSTDIAVIKIEKSGLSAMTFGNSDNVRVGEWVLAVGNPFSLESTVTAGIISAIGRDISILKNKMNQQYQKTGKIGESPIESFIQTDAAINPGNSGGALVNLRGELIGINTAIASPNGAYAGYAFAVPSSIVKKVTTDIIKYGNVQRGYLGIIPVELNSKNAKELDLKISDGIYADEVPTDGGAYAAGIRKGDVVLEVDGLSVTSEPKFRELIGRKRPGETVRIMVDRNGKKKSFDATLRNREGGEGIVKKTSVTASVFSKMGVELEDISAKDKEKIGVRNGVRVKKLYDEGDIARSTDIKEGFIVTRVGNVRVNSEADFKKAVVSAKEEKEDGILICGVYEGYSRNYCFGVALN
ncbi:MAG: serine protease Do [Oceanospirillaceae bacterium]